MKKELIEEIESLTGENIDFFIQFWRDQTNIKMADIDPLQADILFYLNSLKHYKSKVEEMQNGLKHWENFANHLNNITSCSMTKNEIRQALNTFSQKGESQ